MLSNDLQPLTFLKTPVSPTANLIVSPAPGIQILSDGALDLCEDQLAAEMQRFSANNVRTLVALVEDEELEAVVFCDISDAANAVGIKVLRFPIPDYGVPGPDQDTDWLSIKTAMIGDLENGYNVAVHCLAGIGRSFMVAGGVLVCLGQEPEDTFKAIRTLQPDALETSKQVNFLWAQHQPDS